MGSVDPRLEVISGLTGLEWRTGVRRIVSNKNNELSTVPPVREQPPNVFFARGVVPWAKSWVVETVLDVNHDERIRHVTTVSLRVDQIFGKVSLTSFHWEILGCVGAGDNMFANFLIGLREGLEASLIVGILVAFALKVDRRDLIGRIWSGVGAAVIVSLGTGAAIFYVLAESGEAVEPIIVGSLSVLAAGLLTWMIFWMAKTARNLKGSLEGSMQAGISQGGIAIAVVAFTAVVREGVETAVFIWASMNSTGDGLPAMGMAFVGIGVAVILGWIIYRGLLRINLGTFFQWTSVILIVVAAGILAYGVHEFQEVGLLPAGAPVYDATGWLGKETVIGSLLYGLFSYRANPSLLELITWAAYLVPTLTVFVTTTRRANNRRVATNVR